MACMEGFGGLMGWRFRRGLGVAGVAVADAQRGFAMLVAFRTQADGRAAARKFRCGAPSTWVFALLAVLLSIRRHAWTRRRSARFAQVRKVGRSRGLSEDEASAIHFSRHGRALGTCHDSSLPYAIDH